MTTKREWLVENGLATPGRGRLSKEAHAALEWAKAKHLQFEDEPQPFIQFTPAKAFLKKVR